MPTPDNIVELNNLHFRWKNNQPAVLNIPQMHIKKNEKVFIKGPSGCGKSTLLSLLAGILMPDKGDVHLLNTCINKLSSVQRDRFRAHHVGFIFQMFNLLPYLSIQENVLLPCQFSKKRNRRALANNSSLQDEALRLLSHLGLSEPHLLSKPVSELSVGQQQRVAAARALIGKPELLIADEPTSSLDTGRRSNFIQLLFRECEASDTTLIFVSHDVALEALFDRSIDMQSINLAQNEAPMQESVWPSGN